MIPDLRSSFNAAFTGDLYTRYQRALDDAVGEHIEFRVCETPVFLDAAFEARLYTAAREILEQLFTPEYRAASEGAFPPGTKAPAETPHPEFVQVDFAVVDEGQGPDIRLIELQGFPSLYGFQELQGAVAKEVFGLQGLRHLAPGLTRESYVALLRRAVLGGHDPEHVVLLEVDPAHQKTRPDFRVTERLLGIRTVDILTVEKEGRALSYRDEAGRRIPIHRIYNRAIIDEIERLGLRLPFAFTDELDVEWACHPNWFYRISKFSLPWLTHPAVPETRTLDRLERIPDDLERYVLKPLYSFAGGGVVVGPARSDIDAVPADLRSQWLLQRRVTYAPVIDTPEGGTRVELRVMMVWVDEPVPVMLLVRMGRGDMMGVRFNAGKRWVGSTCALMRDGSD